MSKRIPGKQYQQKKGMTNPEYWNSKRKIALDKGVCPSHPSRPATSGQRCQECVDNAKACRERRRANGICLSHKDRPAIAGDVHCMDCKIRKKGNWLRGTGVNEEEIKRAGQAWRIFDNQCQACGSSDPGTKGWTTDHDHETLKFRGILCSGCNLALGYVQDSVIRLKHLMNYLGASKCL